MKEVERSNQVVAVWVTLYELLEIKSLNDGFFLEVACTV